MANSYGGPEALDLIESEVPAPGPGSVTLRAMAIGTNPVDYKLYSGAMGDDPAALPMPVGLELSGVVTAVGQGAEGPDGPLSAGDEVIAHPAPGAYATELTVPAAGVVPKPAEMSWEAASGLLLAGGTAVHALTVVGVTEGETLLIHGASGGVGLLAVQIAAAAGARVIGTAGTGHLEAVERYGATALPYGEGLLERVREAAPGGVDAVVDTSGTREAIDASLELVPDRGRIVSVLAFDRGDTGIKLIGGAPNADPGTRIRADAWRQLVALARRGELEVPVARTYSLAEAAEAHRFLAEGHSGGKVVLLP
ncbi:alcohol dehydrogenase [Streptomyces abyssalis]|uniref:Alcohol dehydrogenase n=1 Tax=Streptomyces abyssalis TaxID=933944 RepID=A0A1E7JR39_9ACTN|nr:alcohol dehydrogenase [Streptomyces abyssalis]OEU95358.1 alcohol dehydrogenase [Streptomyces abyssalis]OEV28780.1 alcohol dehydrogenase [Streptomyces nanshensis]